MKKLNKNFNSKDATIFILDVGANTNEVDKLKSKSFFEEAKSCIESAITRKVIGIYTVVFENRKKN